MARGLLCLRAEELTNVTFIDFAVRRTFTLTGLDHSRRGWMTRRRQRGQLPLRTDLHHPQRLHVSDLRQQRQQVQRVLLQELYLRL